MVLFGLLRTFKIIISREAQSIFSLVLGGLSTIYTLKKITEIALTHANLKMMKIAITLMMIIQIITKVSFQMHFCWLGTFFV